jgi:hypothetical protein
MANKFYRKPTVKKSTKEIPMCETCLKDVNNKDMKPEMFFWVDKESHYSLHCIDCVEENGLKIHHPYKDPSKKVGRPKKKTTEK